MSRPADPLRQELEDLRNRLADADETLRAIRSGEVDAIVVATAPGQERVYTLSSADRAYRNFVENMSDGAATMSPDGIVLYANRALAELVGTAGPRVVGHPFLNLITAGSQERFEKMTGADCAGGSVEASLLTAAGDTVPVLIGVSPRLQMDGESLTCLTVTDLTSERMAEAELAYLAKHDALTGLPNRSVLHARITSALERGRPGTSLTALLFCDVDGFKNINDAFGHHVGDDTLCIVAQRLAAAIRPNDTVARIGGDEFVILCEGVANVDDAALVAARVRTAVAVPIATAHGELEVTISIGIAVAALDGDANSDTLLRDADEAMYKAKRQGPNVIELFDEPLRTMAAARLRMLSELRHAVGGGQLRLHYQPVMNLEDESVAGVEALVRWQHPTRGLVGPDEFIPFAERSGLIIAIGSWVMREACQQAARWARTEHHGPPRRMAVNVSGRQLAQGAGLVQSVQKALEESGFDPTMLVLEVTESALMDDAEAALRVLNELKSLGVSIAIDDFGTGYSSLLYLKRFPVDVLKIDRTFVAGLGVSQDDLAIVHSVVELSAAFGIAAVAEGIETEDQLETLRSLGCVLGQGWLWSPALSAADVWPVLFPNASDAPPASPAPTGSNTRGTPTTSDGSHPSGPGWTDLGAAVG